MNKIFNNLLLAVDQFLPKLRLGQSVFTYSACGPLLILCYELSHGHIKSKI